jgi:hypothetical protein
MKELNHIFFTFFKFNITTILLQKLAFIWTHGVLNENLDCLRCLKEPNHIVLTFLNSTLHTRYDVTSNAGFYLDAQEF